MIRRRAQECADGLAREAAMLWGVTNSLPFAKLLGMSPHFASGVKF